MESLENYLLQRAGQFFGKPKEQFADAYTLEVIDQLGTETVFSIKQFQPSRFTDSTKQIIVKLQVVSVGSGGRLYVSLQFHRSRIFTTYTIRTQAEDARELALGLKSGIDQLINTQGSVRKYLNPHPVVTFLELWQRRCFSAHWSLVKLINGLLSVYGLFCSLLYTLGCAANTCPTPSLIQSARTG